MKRELNVIFGTLASNDPSGFKSTGALLIGDNQIELRGKKRQPFYWPLFVAAWLLGLFLSHWGIQEGIPYFGVIALVAVIVIAQTLGHRRAHITLERAEVRVQSRTKAKLELLLTSPNHARSPRCVITAESEDDADAIVRFIECGDSSLPPLAPDSPLTATIPPREPRFSLPQKLALIISLLGLCVSGTQFYLNQFYHHDQLRLQVTDFFVSESNLTIKLLLSNNGSGTAIITNADLRLSDETKLPWTVEGNSIQEFPRIKPNDSEIVTVLIKPSESVRALLRMSNYDRPSAFEYSEKHETIEEDFGTHLGLAGALFNNHDVEVRMRFDYTTTAVRLRRANLPLLAIVNGSYWRERDLYFVAVAAEPMMPAKDSGTTLRNDSKKKSKHITFRDYVLLPEENSVRLVDPRDLASAGDTVAVPEFFRRVVAFSVNVRTFEEAREYTRISSLQEIPADTLLKFMKSEKGKEFTEEIARKLFQEGKN